MRLIDADALLDKQECLFMKRHILFHGVTAYTIESAPTIDPETLPIVQELCKELERVKEDRDAAISDLYYACACETCELQYTDKCPLKKGMVPCSHIASALRNNTTYKWRGIQEVQEDE